MKLFFSTLTGQHEKNEGENCFSKISSTDLLCTTILGTTMGFVIKTMKIFCMAHNDLNSSTQEEELLEGPN